MFRHHAPEALGEWTGLVPRWASLDVGEYVLARASEELIWGVDTYCYDPVKGDFPKQPLQEVAWEVVWVA